MLEDLRADYEIKVVEAAGTNEEMVQTIQLEDLDRVITPSNLVTVYIPPVPRGTTEPSIYHITFDHTIFKKSRWLSLGSKTNT